MMGERVPIEQKGANNSFKYPASIVVLNGVYLQSSRVMFSILAGDVISSVSFCRFG